jgi:hypothetical protein
VKLLEDWKKHEHVLAPVAVGLLALLVLFPLLGTFGLWDPQEIQVADQARELVKTGDVQKIYKTKPPLTLFLVAQSMKLGGVSEFSARLPLALLGLIAALATYAIGARLRRPRAGLYAALVLLSSPLFIFESRQLTSDVATLACHAVAMVGLVGLVGPANGRYHPVWTTIDVLLAFIGLRAGFYAAGLLVGVCVPLIGASVAALVALAGRFETVPRHILAAGTAIVGLATLVILYVALDRIYDWTKAQPGQIALFGKTLAPARGYIPAIGGLWRAGPPPAATTFDTIVNQVAFGMFPFSALAPLAVLRLAAPRARDRAAWGGLVAQFRALAAYVVCPIWVRKVGDIRYPALPAIAVATGLFLDDVIRAKVEGDPSHAPTARFGMPLAALFVVCAAVQLARDCLNFPEELAAVHLLGTIKYPTELKVMGFILAFGVLFGLVTAIGLWVRTELDGPPPEETKGGPPYRQAFRRAARQLERMRGPARFSLHAAIGIAVLFGLFCSLVFTPRLSQHFSYKNVFQSYFDHRKGGEPLGVMGIPGSGPEYYAKGDFERLDKEGRGRQSLLAFLKRVERVFAVVPASELCPVHQASGADAFEYHVLDNRNSRFLLLSNRLLGGEKDQNPLLTAIRRDLPAFQRALNVNFDGKIELIGVDLPETVSHGDMLKITLYFHVLEKPSQNYKILAHFDGRGVRFQGDHDPIEGRCGTTYWQKGDYVVDTFSVKAGEITHPRGMYTVWVGFFTGSAGQWRNLPITSGNGAADNRFNLGTIRVR